VKTKESEDAWQSFVGFRIVDFRIGPGSVQEQAVRKKEQAVRTLGRALELRRVKDLRVLGSYGLGSTWKRTRASCEDERESCEDAWQSFVGFRIIGFRILGLRTGLGSLLEYLAGTRSNL
jgi:hypothetical protein